MTIILETARLLLRTWENNDISSLAAMNADPEVMRYFPATQDLASTQANVECWQAHYEQFGYGLYAVELTATKAFIGFVGLNQPSFEIPHFKPQGLPIVEIGWRLAAAHWNKGYATEAADAVLHYGFSTLNLPEIISFTVVNNLPSRRVMEKIGLHHSNEDDFDHPKLDATSPFQRHVLYRLTQKEYFSRS